MDANEVQDYQAAYSAAQVEWWGNQDALARATLIREHEAYSVATHDRSASEMGWADGIADCIIMAHAR
jgi:hypothetical protein